MKCIQIFAESPSEKAQSHKGCQENVTDHPMPWLRRQKQEILDAQYYTGFQSSGVQNMELTLNNSKMKCYSSSADVCWQSHSGKEFVLVAQIHWGEGKTTQLHQFLKHI